MSTDDQQQLVRDLAEKIDLLSPYDWTHLEFSDAEALILFAAYVKAELAKRGYACWDEGRYSQPQRRVQFASWDLFSEICTGTFYDPTDPLSEAIAVCKAAWEVIGGKVAEN